ncbi:FAD-dependent thymidylate synthase [Dissulfurirhabdus thermomarina]|uniref:FAD-dependent thymidylate synthase n=1 Tax=Dissulfurirhabdus thermomarina TaxID=1765737 RepID=A0A6N9TQ88_DISTH|nr:FAD-dependent thymidylate synthase [Dissulfurirhabdus thermomarina]NDY43435.1 FAD-dependent thymidylate synthase [Dissulfurirhabdus thermomarina]NMX23961.1 FAD-dependent thymidylate synthase [Dissulfurirhabdus thermomarina]
MKIVSPGFEVLDDYFRQGRVLEQIERCGRVCYKSEDRISPASAVPFIRGIIQRGHESVLEMAQLVLEVEVDGESTVQKFFERIPRFFQADRLGKGRFLLSGNPRAFRDAAREHKDLKIVKAVLRHLVEVHPALFEDLAPRHGWVPQDGVRVRSLAAPEVDALPVELLVRHRTLLVHLVVNRAVTHELVRHRVASYLQESQRYCRYGEDRFGGEVAFIRPCFFEEGTAGFELWAEAMETTERIYLELLKRHSPQAARTVLPNSCKTEIMVHATLAEWFHIVRLRASKAADPSMREIMRLLFPELARRFPAVFEPLADALRDA